MCLDLRARPLLHLRLQNCLIPSCNKPAKHCSSSILLRSTCGPERVRVWPDGTQRGFKTPQSQQRPYEAVNPSLGSTRGGPFRRECCSSALDYASMTVVIPSKESLQWEYPSCPRRVAPQIVNLQMKNLFQRSCSRPTLSQPGRL